MQADMEAYEEAATRLQGRPRPHDPTPALRQGNARDARLPAPQYRGRTASCTAISRGGSRAPVRSLHAGHARQSDASFSLRAAEVEELEKLLH